MALNWDKEFLRDKRKGRFRTVKNDKGEKVPSHCDKCGEKIYIYIQGEPIFKCGKCSKYFGTVQFNESKNSPKKIIVNEKQFKLISEEVVADGNSDHNPYKKKWDAERDSLISFIVNNGKLMTSKENGKKYYTLFDEMLSKYMGINFVLCVQYNEKDLKPGSIVYIRAQAKFTPQLFNDIKFDSRGRDNISGTQDDLN